MNHVLLSIVSPVYRAEKIVDKLVSEIIKNVKPISPNFEIILVEDRSPDSSWSVIKKNCELDKRVKGIRLSKNFGQHYAISAGIKAAKGKWVVVMDCDLQDRPEEINKLYKKAQEGYDIVFARRLNRQDNWLKKSFSSIFHSILGFLTGVQQDSSIANFGIYHKKTIKAVNQMGDSMRNFNSMIHWVGFKTCAINVTHGSREEGESSYSFKKGLELAINTMLSFSDRPLRLTVQLGFIISFSSFLLGLIYLARALAGGISVLGYASLIISIWFLSGIIVFILGIIGLYIGKTFEKVKNRPLYIIDEEIGF